MLSQNLNHIALISVHGDPAVEIGKEEAGGQNVYVRCVGEALARQGWQVDLFTRRTSPEQEPIVQHADNCRTIRLTAGEADFIPRDEIFNSLPIFVEQFLDTQRELGIRYPLIHTNYWLSGWVGLELKTRQNIQLVHTYHSLGAVKYQNTSMVPLIAKTRLAVEKACLEQANRVVATSPQEEQHLRSLVSRQGYTEVIPCATDVERFGSISRIQARQHLGIDLDIQMIFYVGRFDPRKGIETLVRAVNQIQSTNCDRNLRLVIGGGSRPGRSDGQERDRIEGIVNSLGLESFTEFPGRISDENLPIYYAAADVVVVPSHYEPFGLVAIEAMASGTPVVASDVGGLQFTVIPEQTGLRVPPKDVAGFAQAIQRILDNPDWQHQLGQNARQRVEQQFSWDGIAAELSHLYCKLLAEGDQNLTLTSATA
ncbi:MAG: glycosyltransferase family 4 protein [Thainema sp.]